jgi:transcriptional regulator with XRE-family HTH domain
MITGPKLKAIRALKGMSQADLAHVAGVSPVTIATFEAGKSDLRSSTILKLCRALGVTITYKVDGTEISGP